MTRTDANKRQGQFVSIRVIRGQPALVVALPVHFEPFEAILIYSIRLRRTLAVSINQLCMQRK